MEILFHAAKQSHWIRNRVNLIPELELMVNLEIGIDYLKNGIDKLGIGIEVSIKKSTN